MKYLYIICCLVLLTTKPAAQNQHIGWNTKAQLNRMVLQKKQNPSDAFWTNKYILPWNGRPYKVPLKQRLDSIVTYSVNPSRVTSKFEFQFNAEGLETSNSSQFLDETSNTLTNTSKSEQKYDLKSRLVQYLAYIGDGDDWINYIRNDYSYDSKDLITGQISYIWDVTNSVWQTNIKTVFSYDAKNFLILAIDSIWDDSKKKWNLNTKVEITNDAAGRPLTVIFSFWNTVFKQWDYAGRDEFKYNQAGQEISYINSVWDENNFDWLYTSRFLNNRNGFGSVILYLVSSWDGTQWVDQDKSEYMLDGNQNMISEMHYLWNENLNRWNLLLRANCSYDNSFSFEQLLLPFNTGFNNEIYFKHKLNTVMYYHENSGNFINDENVLLYYSPVNITTTLNINEAEYILIPNPVKDCFRISGDGSQLVDLQIIRMDGVEVYSKKIYSNEMIAANEFCTGLYMYRLFNDGRLSGKGLFQVIK